MEYNEYRGVRGLVCAEVEEDNGTVYSTKAWRVLSGVQSVATSRSESSESKYYDNSARIVIDAEGADEVTLVVSALDNETRALIEGNDYDETLDMITETPKKKKYFAIGYIGEKTDGTEEFVICYKGKFTGGNITRNTKNDGTESTNVEYTYTGIYTATPVRTKADGTKVSAKSATAPLTSTLTETMIFGTFADDTSTVTALTPDEIKALKAA